MAGMEEHQLALIRQSSAIRDAALAHLAELKQHAFRVGVFILSSSPIDMSLANVLGGSITAMSGIGEGRGFFQGGFSVKGVSLSDAEDPNLFLESAPCAASEAACAFRLPSPPLDERTGLPIRRSRTSAAFLPHPQKRSEDPIELIVNEHHGHVQSITASSEDRLRHTFIIGQTGTGKSTLMENMILQDIRAGRGLAVIDPHGELVESIIGKIPRDRLGDVIFFDLLEQERPMGFNLLEWKTIEDRDLIIDELYLTLDRIWDMRQVGGPIFESNFRGMLKMLMGEKSSGDFVPTILDFTSWMNFKERLNQQLRWREVSVHES
jgi:hypothetical protein